MRFLIDFLIKLETLVNLDQGECDREDERKTLRTQSNIILPQIGLRPEPVVPMTRSDSPLMAVRP